MDKKFIVYPTFSSRSNSNSVLSYRCSQCTSHPEMNSPILVLWKPRRWVIGFLEISVLPPSAILVQDGVFVPLFMFWEAYHLIKRIELVRSSDVVIIAKCLPLIVLNDDHAMIVVLCGLKSLFDLTEAFGFHCYPPFHCLLIERICLLQDTVAVLRF